jgi:hypothetical protein
MLDAASNMTDMVAATEASDNGDVPARKHRRFQPWAEFELGPKEVAAQSRIYPLRVLVHALQGNDEFREGVARVRAGDLEADELARRYVRRAGRPRGVMHTMIERATSNPLTWAWSLTATVVFEDEPLAGGDPQEWTHARRYPHAATMLVRLGAYRCLTCGAVLAEDGGVQRRYCSVHEAAARYRARADRELILGLLNATDEALGASADR